MRDLLFISGGFDIFMRNDGVRENGTEQGKRTPARIVLSFNIQVKVEKR